MSEPNYKEIFYGLIASLTLCDHMGDVQGDIDTALKKAGDEIEFDEMGELMDVLASRGIRTLYGTELR